jgi:polysaccharide biosynthesis protein PslH
VNLASPQSVVLVTASEPEPRSFGKQVVIGGLLDHLCERLGADRVHVVLISSIRERPATQYAVHVIEKPRPAEQLRALATRVALPPHSSLQEAALWSSDVRRELRTVLVTINADLEIWDTMRTGQYALTMPRGPRILYADDLFSKRYGTMRDRMRTDPSGLGNPLGEFAKMLPGVAGTLAARPWICRRLLQIERRLTYRSEQRAPAHFDITVLVNPAETAELIQRSGSPAARTLLPLLREPPKRRRHFGGSPTFVFVGGLDFPPNRDGLTWFLRECREPVLRAIPGFRLLLVGRGSNTPPPEAAAWGGHVEPLGWVENLDDVLLSVAGMVSPLQVGSGVKIKVLEALARGLPVVATRQGVLGLDVGADDGCLIADTPAELAQGLAEATDPVRNQALSAAALRRWQMSFAPSVAARTYDEVLGLTPQPIADRV